MAVSLRGCCKLLGVETHCRPPSAPSQFPDIVEFSETMANAGKTVIVAALDGTFQRKVSHLIQVLGRGLEGEGGPGRSRDSPASLCSQRGATWMTGA